jgi:hypothetical protein
VEAAAPALEAHPVALPLPNGPTARSLRELADVGRELDEEHAEPYGENVRPAAAGAVLDRKLGAAR